jgi:hypothetical protein
MESLVGMDDYALKSVQRQIAIVLHILNCFQNNAHFQMSGQFPADRFACRDILNYQEVSKPMIKEQIGYVSAEYFVRHNLVEFSIYYVFKCPMLGRFLHNGAIWIYSPNLGKQPIFFHYPDYFLVIHHYFFVSPQPHFNGSKSVFGFALLKQFIDCQIVRIVFVLIVSGL